MMLNRAVAAFLMVALSATAQAEGKYTIQYVEFNPAKDGVPRARFVEDQADLSEVLAGLKSPDKYRRFDIIRWCPVSVERMED